MAQRLSNAAPSIPTPRDASAAVPIGHSRFVIRLHESAIPNLTIADGLLKFSGALNAEGHAVFVLANGTKRGHNCLVEITENIRQHAAEQGLSQNEALNKGWEEDSRRFVAHGAEVYAKPPP